jgi:predicted nucleic acid-binding protein
VPATLVDTSVLLDVLHEDEAWFDWSAAMLAACGERGRLYINPVIYAEASVQFATREELDAALTPWVEPLPLPWEAAFLAGKAFERYRRRGGVKTRPLPDFFVGAQAAVSRLAVLTRDPKHIRRYFSTVRVIAP